MPRERYNERLCDKAIRDTLAYRAVFKYPLSYYQLVNQLISKRSFDQQFFDKELNKMVKKGYIACKESRFYDKRTKPVSWEQRHKATQRIFKKLRQVVILLRKIPWIRLLAITGSVAAYNTDKNSDIDVFIITTKNRLWLTRGFVAATLKILGIYITRDADPGKICPNLLIDETALAWPDKERSVFTAHEIVLMQPLINKGNAYFAFLKANTWVKNYFPNFQVDTEFTSKKSGAESKLVDLLEKLAMRAQTYYMKKKKTSEVTKPHMIHFKKNDNSGWILEGYNKLAHYNK